MSLLNALRKPGVQASVQSALVTSTNVPNSGLTFVDNSQGCSAAIAELSGLLDVAIDQFDGEREPGDQLQLQLKRLYNKAENYSNTLDADIESVEPWNCSRHDAEIISAAFACSAAVYDPDANPSVPGLVFDRKSFIGPSIGGTTKATEIYVVKQADNGDPEPRSLLPMVIIAIRGTASRVDRMVNLNGGSKTLCLPTSRNKDDDRLPILSHAGFLNAAEDLEPIVARKLKETMIYHNVNHVVFTGHSAGGATASLLFAKYLSRAGTDYPSIKFSSISFGAPPVIQQDLESYLFAPTVSKSRGLVLSIVNEYDLVPRTDGAYIRSLVDLYRSMYNLPPIQDTSLSQISQDSDLSLPRFSFEKNDTVEISEREEWPMPTPIYWHIGKIVVLRTEILEGEDDKDDELVMSAVAVGKKKFGNLLWCSCAVHKRVRYMERVELLREGRFNGRAGW